MNFLPSTINFGKFITRFWLANNAATSQAVGFLFPGPTTTVVGITSENQKIRGLAFNGAGPAVPFTAVSSVKFWGAYLFSGSSTPATLTALNCSNIGLAGIGPVKNVLDLSPFPNLSGTINLTGSTYNKVVVAAGAGVTMLVRNNQMTAVSLDFSQCICGSLAANTTYCTGVIVPVSNAVMTSFTMTEHRIIDADLVLPSYSNLTVLDFSTGQLNTGRFLTVDVSLVPKIAALNFGNTGVKTFMVGSNPFTALRTLSLSNGRLTARNVAWGNGGFSTLITLVTRGVGLTSITLAGNGLTESEQTQLIDLLISSAASRAPATAKTLVLGGDQASNSYYPYQFNNAINNIPVGAANAPFVTQAGRGKIAGLVANNAWAITYNKAIFMRVVALSGTTIRATYNGVDNIDVWAIGDTVTVANTTDAAVPNGTYTVLAGAGKVWDFTAPSAVGTLTGSFGVASFDK